MSLLRIAPLPALVLLAACASSGTTPETAPRPATQTVRVEGVGSLTLNKSPAASSSKTVPFPIEQVWATMPAVYDSLGIPVTMHDPASHTIANEGLKTRQRLGKTSLSRYLDCGNTQMGPSADSYDVFLTIGTQLRPAESGTLVTTSMEATAKSIQFSQAASQCTSNGELEMRVHTVLTMLLAAQARR